MKRQASSSKRIRTDSNEVTTDTPIDVWSFEDVNEQSTERPRPEKRSRMELESIGLVDKRSLANEEPEGQHSHRPNRCKLRKFRCFHQLNKLYDEMSHHGSKKSFSEFNDILRVKSSMSQPLNVKLLVDNVENASSEQNAKVIAALAIKINYKKQHTNILDKRQNPEINDRKLDLYAKLTENWLIKDDRPLRKIDLVETARNLYQQEGKT